MKTVLSIVCFVLALNCYSQKIEIPDKNFEQLLVDLKIDSDKKVNGYLLKSDALLVTSLDISNSSIKDLTGIESFTSLQYLYCYDTQLTNLNLKENISLISLLTNVSNVIYPNETFWKMDWFD